MSKLLYILTALFFLTSCSVMMSEEPLLIKGYNYAQKKIVVVDKVLNELSGIAYDARSNRFLAVNDEKGILYCLDASTYQIVAKIHFGEKGDYEEVQILNDLVYILRSDGMITRMRYDGTAVSEVKLFEYKGEKAEYESFYINAATNELILIPKKSKQYHTKEVLQTYAMDAESGVHKDNFSYQLTWSELKTTTTLHPSAIAVHPVTKQLYLLASIEKRLVIMDASWTVLSEHLLENGNFQQPEGITFDSEANLYITNEAGEKEPTIVVIPKAKE